MPAPIRPSRAARDKVICFFFILFFSCVFFFFFSCGPPFGFVKEPQPNWRTTNYGQEFNQEHEQ